MKPNPKIFEGYVDPAGGEWIKVKSGKFENVIWRPANMKLEDEKTGKVVYNIELLNDNISKWDKGKKILFYKVADSIIADIMMKGVTDER